MLHKSVRVSTLYFTRQALKNQTTKITLLNLKIMQHEGLLHRLRIKEVI